MTNSTRRQKPRIVIVGGGFAGAFTARNLRRRLGDEATVELINDTNYFVFQPLLPEVAAGIIAAPDAVTPLRIMLPGVRVRMGRAYKVDFDRQVVLLVQGTKRVPIEVEYDHLVLAVGQRSNLDLLPGFQEHSLGMKNLGDAHRLRNHVIQCLEHADVTGDQALKKRLLTFVVAGGGFSGVETMGELFEMIQRTLPLYPNIATDELRAILIQRGERLLPELPDELGDYSHQLLTKRGVDVRTRTGILGASAQAVELDDGTSIETLTLVSTIASGPTELVTQLGVELERGKLPTDEFLHLRGRAQVWAIGDSAGVVIDPATKMLAPPTAQFATAQAEQLAANIVATIKDKPLKPFAFVPKGALASLGHYSAVAQLYGLRLSGLLAWFLWRGFYIMRLPGFATKVRVTLNWFFDYFLPRNTVQIQTHATRATRYVRVKKGERLFAPGQLPDGFYAVVEGLLESRVQEPTSGESADELSASANDFVRLLGPGDHWGERAVSGDLETKGSLVAKEDSLVMIINNTDFKQLRRSLPMLDRYFDQIPEAAYPQALRRDDGLGDSQE